MSVDMCTPCNNQHTDGNMLQCPGLNRGQQVFCIENFLVDPFQIGTVSIITWTKCTVSVYAELQFG